MTTVMNSHDTMIVTIAGLVVLALIAVLFVCMVMRSRDF